MTSRVATIQLTRISSDKATDAPKRAELIVELRRKENVSPKKNIDLQECLRYTELSIVASVWYPGDNYNNPSVWGQCVETILEHWGDDPAIAELCAIWKRWHLNGMTPGTDVIKRIGELCRELGTIQKEGDKIT